MITRNIDLSVEVDDRPDRLRRRRRPPAPLAQRARGLGRSACCSALGLGMVNGADRHDLQGALDRGHAGHAEHLPRHRFFVAGGHQVNVVDLPPGYSSPATATVLGIPVFVLVAVAVVVVAALVLRYTRFGRRFYAVGSNPEAASIPASACAGSCSSRSPLSGLLAGVAGIMWGIYFGTIYATSASGLMLADRRGGRRRRRRDRSADRGPSWVRRSGRCSSPCQQRAAPPPAAAGAAPGHLRRRDPDRRRDRRDRAAAGAARQRRRGRAMTAQAQAPGAPHAPPGRVRALGGPAVRDPARADLDRHPDVRRLPDAAQLLEPRELRDGGRDHGAAR